MEYEIDWNLKKIVTGRTKGGNHMIKWLTCYVQEKELEKYWKGGVYNDITLNKLPNDVVKVTTNMFLAAKEWISKFRLWKPIWRRIHKFQLFFFFKKNNYSYIILLIATLSCFIYYCIIKDHIALFVSFYGPFILHMWSRFSENNFSIF